MMKIPFLDLSVDEKEQAQLLSAVQRVLTHGRIILGPEVQQLEEATARYCGRKYCVAVGSGTMALYIGCKTLGLTKGDEVITTPLSWIASVNAFYLLGAEPVFADIGDDLNIDPKSVESLITKRTKAILAVDYSGRPCDWDCLKDIADRHRLILIEDGSQAFGASYKGRKAGSFGDMSCMSMNSMKLVASLGEAGVILTNDKELYTEAINQRYCGMIDKTVCHNPSVNGRMDTIQAAILLERFHSFEEKIEKRREIADFYNEKFAGLTTLPKEAEWERCVYYTYLIDVENRTAFLEHMKANGLEVSLRDTMLISDQPVYQGCKRAELKRAKHWVDKLIAIPSSEKLTTEQRDRVADVTLAYLKGK
jgi:dTDP-4-amino-4,6-dideoxygalactose transaminase